MIKGFVIKKRKLLQSFGDQLKKQRKKFKIINTCTGVVKCRLA